jgi:hypothetical protein
MYIVEIEEGVWLSPWDGDPGRTLVKDSAKQFKTENDAGKALGKARALPHRNGFPYAKIEEQDA